MSDAPGAERLGLLGPWRRWRSWTPRERVVLSTVVVLSSVVAAAAWYLIGPLRGDGDSVAGAVFFAVAMMLVRFYQPEVVHLWRKADGDS
jgi:hypothetical protein